MKDIPETKKERRKRVLNKGFVKHRRAPIEEARRQYEFIVNTAREFLSLINRQYKYAEVNAAFCQAHKLKREDIIDHPVSSIWGDDVFNAVIRKHLERCFEGHEVNYVSPFRFASLGVRTIDVTYYPYQDRTGRVTHVVVVSRDVTAEKRQEEELLSLKKAVETMQLGVTICDPAGKIQYSNPADARMHGYSADELTGREVKLFAPSEFWKKRTIRSLREISSWNREGVNIRKDGSLFPVQLMSDVVKRHDGRPIGIVTTCEDITGRKRAEEQLIAQLQKLSILRHIDMVILSSLNLKVILNTILDFAVDHLGIHAALVMALNPHTLKLEYAGGRGFHSRSARNISLKLGEGLAGKVAQGRKPVHIPDLRQGQTLPALPAHIAEEDFSFYLGIPLVVKDQVKGTLEFFHREHMSTENGRIEFMEALAGQTAIAIENISLFNDLQQSNTELSHAYDRTLDGWVRALDLRDKETEGHSHRVAEITVRLAKTIGLGEESIVHLRRGALLHDIGKMGIPDDILHKAGPLTEEEWKVMKLHPVYAYQMLTPISFLQPAIDIPYCHHEKWDGSGYPRGLRGEQIPLAARLFSIADIWDALSSDRPYRPAWPAEKVREYLQSLSGTHFEPGIIDLFMQTEF